MKLAVIGLGQAGGKVLDRFLEYDQNTGSYIVHGAVAVNTAEQDLEGLEFVPRQNRLLIGQSEVSGNGVGANNEVGAKIAENDINEIMDKINQIPTHDVDAFLLVAGLGGGTGSGAMPVVGRELREIYSEPVYGLGILPSSEEGSVYTLNAARSLKTCVENLDNLMLFDNNAWDRTGENLGDWYENLNDELVHRFGVLFGAGEVQKDGEVAENVVDSSEINNTLKGGGISTLGYATDTLERDTGLLSRLRPAESGVDATSSGNRVASLIRKATKGRLTLPANVKSAQRGLVVVGGPPKYISRKGTERGRNWLESEADTMEIRGGDYPMENSDKIATVVLLSGLTDVPRIENLQQLAADADEEKERIKQEAEEEFEELMNSSEEVDPLF